MKQWLLLALGIACLFLLLSCQQAEQAGPAGEQATVISSTVATSAPVVGSTEETMKSAKSFDLVYIASGGRPPLAAQLHLFADGRAELYLGSSWSLPQGGLDTVGFFGGTISPDVQSTLNAALIKGDFLNRASEPLPPMPGMVTRSLALTAAGQQAQITIADGSNDPTLVNLEQMLVDIMTNLATQPIRAAQVTMSATSDGANLHPEVTITNVGTQPLPILLFDSAEAGWFVRTELAFQQAGQIGEIVATPREHIVALVDAGELPAGVQQLAPGEAYKIPAPPLAQPATDDTLQLTGTVRFWLPGTGLERRLVHVQVAPIPVK